MPSPALSRCGWLRKRRASGAAFVDALRRYSTRSMPNYRTKYLLGRMTQYVDMAFAGTAFKGTKELGPYLDLEIEHIFCPKIPRTNSATTGNPVIQMPSTTISPSDSGT